MNTLYPKVRHINWTSVKEKCVQCFSVCCVGSCMPPPSAYTLPMPPAPSAGCLQNSPSSYSCMLSGMLLSVLTKSQPQWGEWGVARANMWG